MTMLALQLRQVLLAITLVYATLVDPSTNRSFAAGSASSSSNLELRQRHLHSRRTDDGVFSSITTDVPLWRVVSSRHRSRSSSSNDDDDDDDILIPSIHRHTEKYETIQRHILQRTVEAIVNASTSSSSSSSYRSSSIQRICSPDANGVVFPDDDFNLQLFRSDAAPMCSCYERDNIDLILLGLVSDTSANVTEYLKKLNKAFSKIVGVIEYDCVNTCEHCFTTTSTTSSISNNTNTTNMTNASDTTDTFCGILQTNESSTYRGTEGNFSMAEYSSGQITAASWERLFSESSFSISTCIEYTQNEVGRLCYGSHFTNLSTAPTCYVQYNDTRCQSCTFPHSPIHDVNVTNNDCFIVDCSNIVPDASVINTCTGTGYHGIFRFVELIENGLSDNTTTSVVVGSCDGPPTTAPISPPVATQQAAPSSASSSSSVPAPTIITSAATRRRITMNPLVLVFVFFAGVSVGAFHLLCL